MQKHQGKRRPSLFMCFEALIGLFIVTSCGSVSGTTNKPALSPTITSPSADREAVIIYSTRLFNEDASDAVIARRASDGTLLWRFPIQGSVSSTSSNVVVVDHGIVYISTIFTPNTTDTENPKAMYFLYALRASNGTQLWRYQANDDSNSISVADGAVYILSSFSTSLAVLRASDGHLLWKHTTGTPTIMVMTGLVISSGVVYISTGEGSLKFPATGSLYALRASDGSLLWQSQVGKHHFFPLQLVNGIIYVGASDDYWPYYDAHPQPFSASLYAVRASDGSQLWHSEIWSSQLVQLRYQESQGIVYVTTTASGSSSSSTVRAFQAKEGTSLWQSPVLDLLTGVTVADGVIYAYTDTGRLDALRSNNGAALWNTQVPPQDSMPPSFQLQTDEERAFLMSTFRNTGNGINLGAEPATLEVRKAMDGTVIWQYPYQSKKYTTFTLNNGMIYIGASSNILEVPNASICVRQASTGTQLWCIQTDTRVQHLTIGS